MPYFHGGPAGLTGGLVLPPSETGVEPCNRVSRRDRVYVVTQEEDALLYAVLHPSGSGKVYLVEPIGALAPDPDCKVEGLSFECERARVVSVWRVPSSGDRRRLLKSLGLWV